MTETIIERFQQAMSVDNPVFEKQRGKPIGEGPGYSAYLEDGRADRGNRRMPTELWQLIEG